MGSPEFPETTPIPVLPPLDEVRSRRFLHSPRLRGATLIAGRRTKRNEGTLGASILGGAMGGLKVGQGGSTSA